MGVCWHTHTPLHYTTSNNWIRRFLALRGHQHLWDAEKPPESTTRLADINKYDSEIRVRTETNAKSILKCSASDMGFCLYHCVLRLSIS